VRPEEQDEFYAAHRTPDRVEPVVAVGDTITR
jgi:hypothetical protein